MLSIYNEYSHRAINLLDVYLFYKIIIYGKRMRD